MIYRRVIHGMHAGGILYWLLLVCGHYSLWAVDAGNVPLVRRCTLCERKGANRGH